jgi:succinyl-CoA synthetase beta subunit
MAAAMLGHRLRTKQTSEEGLLVKKLFMTEKVAYEKEFYLSITVDRKSCCPVIVASRCGGTDIEAAAKADPQSIARVSLNYETGVSEVEAAVVARALDLKNNSDVRRLQKLLSDLYSLFKSTDATLLEVNPLVQTSSGELTCLDSKFSFDNASQFRQKSLFALEEKDSPDSEEVEAEKLGFSYVRLDGNIGNIVNGAGLAMATNDAVNYFGGHCANFLDAGGKATKETMADAFRIVLSDPRVKVIFINIYGGKTRHI